MLKKCLSLTSATNKEELADYIDEFTRVESSSELFLEILADRIAYEYIQYLIEAPEISVDENNYTRCNGKYIRTIDGETYEVNISSSVQVTSELLLIRATPHKRMNNTATVVMGDTVIHSIVHRESGVSIFEDFTIMASRKFSYCHTKSPVELERKMSRYNSLPLDSRRTDLVYELVDITGQEMGAQASSIIVTLLIVLTVHGLAIEYEADDAKFYYREVVDVDYETMKSATKEVVQANKDILKVLMDEHDYGNLINRQKLLYHDFEEDDHDET